MKFNDLEQKDYCNQGVNWSHERVWYASSKSYEFSCFTMPNQTHPLLFEKEQPLCIEYCSGNGSWIAAKAQQFPDYNWIAVEKKFERARKIWLKTKNLSLSNLITICGEGYYMTQQYVSTSSIHSAYINFPDPWPKRRHASNRLVQHSFMKEIHRILQPDGVVTLVTDDESCSKCMIDVLRHVSGFHSLFEEPFYVNEFPLYGTSFFEDLWRQKGKSIRYHAFCKKDSVPYA